MGKESRGAVEDLERKLDRAVSAEERAAVMADLARAMIYSSPSRSINLADRALQIFGELNMESRLPGCYMSRAKGLLQMFRLRDAETTAEISKDLCKRLGDRNGVRNALNLMGSIYFRWGRFTEALENYREAMSVHMELQDSPDPGILANIGAVHLQMGDMERALDCYTSVQKTLREKDGSSDLKTSALIGIGEIYAITGMHEAALESLSSAEDAAAESDMKQAMAVTADRRGGVLVDMGRYSEARETFRRALEMFRSLEDRKGEALVLAGMGRCYLAEGDGREALSRFRESYMIFHSLNDSRGESDTLTGMARSLAASGGREEALEKLSEALEIAGSKGLKPQLSEIHLELSRIFENDGEYRKALMHLQLHYEQEERRRSERAANRLRNYRVLHNVEEAKREAAILRVENEHLLERIKELENDRQNALRDCDDRMEIQGTREIPAFEYRTPDSSSNEKRVLVVEDDPKMAELIAGAFEAGGYPVMAVPSLERAREVLEDSRDSVSCVFSDVLLPDGSGIDLLREIRNHDRSLPLIAGSGYPLSARDMEYLVENRIVFLEKPYSIDTLMLKLSTMLPT